VSCEHWLRFLVVKLLQLLPFKYGVKLDGEDSIINGIPATDLLYVILNIALLLTFGTDFCHIELIRVTFLSVQWRFCQCCRINLIVYLLELAIQPCSCC